jgi:ubiquinone/menaquinone biosynthesis C-methylase UbiE
MKYFNFLFKSSKSNKMIEPAIDKYDSELSFWEHTLVDYVNWYNGEMPEMYDTKSPNENEKVFFLNDSFSSILTWKKLHQEKKYLYDLDLQPDTFDGMKLLDIGAGPIPSAEAFEGADLYALDPLIPRYLAAGYPLHIYKSTKFVSGYAENMPLPDNYFDAVISVNALDHVDDFEKTVSEIRRVLKQDGLIRIHLHYHPPTVNEPIVLNDERVDTAFSWCNGFKKIIQKNSKLGYTCAEGESYAVWSNF